MFSTSPTRDEELNAKTRKTADDVRDGVRRVKGDVESIGDTLRSNTSGLRNNIEDMAREAGQQVRDFASNAETSLSDATSTVTSRIRENPLQSSAIALAAGVVLGMLFRRR